MRPQADGGIIRNAADYNVAVKLGILDPAKAVSPRQSGLQAMPWPRHDRVHTKPIKGGPRHEFWAEPRQAQGNPAGASGRRPVRPNISSPSPGAGQSSGRIRGTDRLLPCYEFMPSR